MKKAEFVTPVVTIFDEEGNIDEKGNKIVYDNLIKNDIDGIIIMGSTGEFFAMDMSQKKQLINLAVPYINHRSKCYIGTGCMSAKDTIELSNYALKAGADAVMIIGPYYMALGERHIKAYYDEVATRVKGSIFIYNFPGCTGYDMTSEITSYLIKKHSNITGYKDTVDEFGHTRSIIETVRKLSDDFVIYSGYDENLVHTVMSGGNGCIGGLSNLYPEICSAWTKAIDSNDIAAMQKWQKAINTLMALYSIDQPFVPVLKRAMKLRGMNICDHCIEFAPVTEAQEEEIKTLLNTFS